MKTILFIVCVLALTACCDESAHKVDRDTQEKATAAYAMSCTYQLSPHTSVYSRRCENSEVICYQLDHGVSCKFKTP
jgi:hypothetical protein